MNLEVPGDELSLESERNAKENRSPPGNVPEVGQLVVNGISNGYQEKHSKKEHKSEHKDKHRDKERHKDKHKEHRDKDRDKEKHRDKSSSGKDKEKHSSSSSKDKDRDRDREKDKEREKDKDKDRERDKDKVREKEKERDKDKEKKHKDERKDKDREHKSSSSKDKEHKSSSSEKEHKSSSSSKDKDKHSSNSSSKDKDKDRHSSSSHRDKEKDRDKHSSSSSKDKERHSSSSKEKVSSSSDKKHSDKEKHRSKEKDQKDKVKSKEGEHHKEKKEKVERIEQQIEVKIKDEVPEESAEMTDGYQSVPEYQPVEDFKEEPEFEDGEASGGDGDGITNENSLLEETSMSNMDHSNTYIKTELDNIKIEDNSYYSVKSEEDTEDDVPLWARAGKTPLSGMASRASPAIKRKVEDSEDDMPLSARKKVKKEKKKREAESEEEEDFKPKKKKKVKEPKVKTEDKLPESPRKKKKEEEQQEVWKWWEEEKHTDGRKWTFLEHKGPVFAPPYERLPPDVKFYYDGEEMALSEEAEEVATFYARMLDHDYTTKEVFNKNFFKDWRKVMTEKERAKITDLSKCNFKHMHAYFVAKSEERKNMSKEEKKKIKEQNEEITKIYGFCVCDGHKEKIGNFKIEPPGLFRGRGEHPKMGMLKRRVMPEDVIINCSKDAVVPKPPEGHKWKEVRHDNNVTWLASWTENVQGQVKYIMLNPSSKLKGEKDWQKYETARKLAKSIEKIRAEYREDWKSKEMRIRQRAVALYFIDKLALRAGNEKDEDQADTVGCCSLRVEHISLHEEKDGKECVVVFDFLGKDSIRYYNEVSVEKRVFKNLQLFMENKSTGDDLFDRLNTSILNKHLNELMEGLTAKVFRTYNASITLQEQLKQLTNPDFTVAEKILAYNRANRAVAILCNHQRSVPKTHAKSMENLKNKIEAKKEQLEEAERQYKQAKREYKNFESAKNKIDMDKRKKALDRIKEQLSKLEVQATDKEENKEIALGTSKLNYLDPRISVAWCKKFGVPIEKIYNRTQRDKFRWAIDMAGPDYVF
ncbi:DNA topoisomerase I, mitochondrial isoform X1 [Schistocerca serialis cubense]|uniref:DNA topoisomerase I, mitochondrial isoform X1 n=1 Tax=Schistocerca serialis cubense TaxID=2023355 RepID=UPI00214F065B|nr:DNA topoisomerase I, mitochondrial isoform X1 [Schistocerca serialis cubense]